MLSILVKLLNVKVVMQLLSLEKKSMPSRGMKMSKNNSVENIEG
jgi:hypothetical protein